MLSLSHICLNSTCKLPSVCTSPAQQSHRHLVWSLSSDTGHPSSQSIIFMLKSLIYITQLQEFLIFFGLAMCYNNLWIRLSKYWEVSTNRRMRNIHWLMKILEHFWKWAGNMLRDRLLSCSFWLFLCQKHISIRRGRTPSSLLDLTKRRLFKLSLAQSMDRKI